MFPQHLCPTHQHVLDKVGGYLDMLDILGAGGRTTSWMILKNKHLVYKAPLKHKVAIFTERTYFCASGLNTFE